MNPEIVENIDTVSFVVACCYKITPKLGRWANESGGSVFIEDLVGYHEDSNSQNKAWRPFCILEII